MFSRNLLQESGAGSGHFSKDLRLRATRTNKSKPPHKTAIKEIRDDVLDWFNHLRPSTGTPSDIVPLIALAFGASRHRSPARDLPGMAGTASRVK